MEVWQEHEVDVNTNENDDDATVPLDGQIPIAIVLHQQKGGGGEDDEDGHIGGDWLHMLSSMDHVATTVDENNLDISF